MAHDWPTIMSSWAYAFGKPNSTAKLKVQPEDFNVVENMGAEPCGEGEHIWLSVDKRKQNTEAVAKALARHAQVAYRDVSYSGLKDFYACTNQWFSVHKPGKAVVDWSAFKMSGVTIKKHSRHNRKLRRGSHDSNSFVIRLRDYQGDQNELYERIEKIKTNGSPNYFGEQRFGRNLSNLPKAYDLLTSNKQIKNRHLRSLLYSAARAWLFNCIVSQRLKNGTWLNLYPSEPVNLNGSNSFFEADNDVEEVRRLMRFDIHPTAPLWGDYDASKVTIYEELHLLECAIVETFPELTKGLQRARLQYQRRPVRLIAERLGVDFEDGDVCLKFDLPKGQYATSLLRELIQVQ